MARTDLPKNLKQFITGFGNFTLLKAQKTILLNMMATKSSLSEAETSAIEGIILLIDQVQDIAVDQFGYTKNQVFNYAKGEDYVLSLENCECLVISGDDPTPQDEVYYQPEAELLPSWHVYGDKANAEKDWPGCRIVEYKNDDIEDREYID
jgi:hypothetical protein